MTLQQTFPQFTGELINYLQHIGQEVVFKQDDVLMRTGQYFKHAMLILQGRVKLYREGDDGEEFFLYYLEPGQACALSMICATRNEASEVKARAVTEVTAFAIPLQHMDTLMRDHRTWYYFVLENYRSRFEELLQVVDQIAFHAMDEKLEFYLKRQFQSIKTNTLTITHQQVADDMNSSREVVSRLLKKLETQRRIRISRNEITNLGL